MAPPLRILFDDWFAESRKVGATRIPQFKLVRDPDPDRYLYLVAIELGIRHAERLLDSRYQEAAERARLEDALLRFAVPRIERELATGSLPFESSSEVQTITVGDDDVAVLADLLANKSCRYQRREGRDLFCSAADRHDQTAVGSIGLTSLAPTSRPVCARCELPSSEVICSELHHPTVRGEGDISKWEADRRVVGASCDKARPEIARPRGCRAGGHDCWERTVQPVEAPTEPTLSPLILPEQLDFLDTVWRVAFKRPLLQLGPATHVAGLALGCSSREEFTARLTDLADVLGSLHVPADLLPSNHAAGRGSLKRVELALSDTDLDQDGKDRVVAAVSILRSVVRIRVGLQHSDAAKELPEHFGKLQISYPPSDWETAWNQVRARTVDSLVQLRDEVRLLADGAG